MNVTINPGPNSILDGRTPAEKLRAAILAERELVILDQGGRREYLQTGKRAADLAYLVQSKRLQLVRSRELSGQYTLGLFDKQGNLRILVCRARSVPNAPTPYKLVIGGKEIVCEHIEEAQPVVGTAGVVCICSTHW